MQQSLLVNQRACLQLEMLLKRQLTFGYLYDFRNPTQWHRAWADLYAETLEVIAWSESAGFKGAWLPEHHGAEDGYMPSPMVALAAIAARTKTINIGSAVALAPLYHPVRFAEECAVLDILCNGRLEMAVAIGYRRRETDGFGVDFTKRGARLRRVSSDRPQALGGRNRLLRRPTLHLKGCVDHAAAAAWPCAALYRRLC